MEHIKRMGEVQMLSHLDTNVNKLILNLNRNENQNQPEIDEDQIKMKRLFTCIRKHVVDALSILCGVIDILSDLVVLAIFLAYCLVDDNVHTDIVARNLTIALVISFVTSIVLFGIQCRIFSRTRQLYRGRATEEVPKDEKNKLDRKKEVVGYLILLLEDLASTIIIYTAFCKGSCKMFEFVFLEGLKGYLIDTSLYVIFFSNIIKGAKPSYQCFKSLRKNFTAIKTCSDKAEACCFFIRAARPLLVIILVGFTLAIYFEINYVNRGINRRPECMFNRTWDYNNTAVDTESYYYNYQDEYSFFYG